MKALEYPTNTGTEEEIQNSFVLTHSEGGTKKIPLSSLTGSGGETSTPPTPSGSFDWFSDDNPVEYRKFMFRGKKLGTEITSAAIDPAVSSGTFDGMYLGDYWELSNGDIWRIAHFDYGLGTAYSTPYVRPNSSHNLVLLPDHAIDFSMVDSSYGKTMKVFESMATGEAVNMTLSNFYTILPVMANSYWSMYLSGLDKTKLLNSDFLVPKEIDYNNGVISMNAAKIDTIFHVPSISQIAGILLQVFNLSNTNSRSSLSVAMRSSEQFSLTRQKSIYTGAYRWNTTNRTWIPNQYWLTDYLGGGMFLLVSEAGKYSTGIGYLSGAWIRPFMIYRV